MTPLKVQVTNAATPQKQEQARSGIKVHSKENGKSQSKVVPENNRARAITYQPVNAAQAETIVAHALADMAD